MRMEKKKMGRPRKEFNKRLFIDLIGIGCGADEICWVFRDENENPANIDTLSRWCKREFGLTFQEFRVKNGAMALKIKLRRNQLDLSEKSAAMAIFLGRNYLGQSDNVIVETPQADSAVEQIAKMLLREKNEESFNI